MEYKVHFYAVPELFLNSRRPLSAGLFWTKL